MEINQNVVIQKCIAGTQAEFQGDHQKAHQLYLEAWELAQTDYEFCVAAHYVARHQEDPNEKFRWNQIALNKANQANVDEVREFFPSLYLNMGQSYELLGNKAEAEKYYKLAADLGLPHQMK